jgi:hypothetical protein
MTNKAFLAICLAAFPIFGCQGQGSAFAKLERVVVAEAMRNSSFAPGWLIGKTFDARSEEYTSLGKDPLDIYFLCVFDDDRSRVFAIVLARRLSVSESALISEEAQRDDDLIVDALVIRKKKVFVVVDHLLTIPPGGNRWEGVDNMLGVSEYNSRQEIIFDRYVIPDFKFRFGDGSAKIERVTNFNGRVYRDSSVR